MGDKVLLPISYVISHYRYRYRRYVLTGCVLPNQNVFCLLQAMKVVGIKAHTENDKGQVLLDLYIRWSFIYELLDVKTISVSLLLRRGYDCSFSMSSATSATWRSTLRWRNTSAKLESKEYRSVEFGHLKSSSPQFWQTRRLLLCLQLHGMMRVILEPLIGDVPIAGAVTMFFIKRPVCPSVLSSARPYIPINIAYPNIVIFAFHAIDFFFASLFLVSSQKLDINWTGLTNLLDIPGLKWVMLELSFMGLSGP